ncbi:uncharacterized protein LOC143179687 [Calliopsis andreniformis]|uniref:uncharacterized protein LOC143179687 n=1 Tax=Calliopsis andreniformis TaxID=337506 RepID=UPI003FCCCF7D
MFEKSKENANVNCRQTTQTARNIFICPDIFTKVPKDKNTEPVFCYYADWNCILKFTCRIKRSCRFERDPNSSNSKGIDDSKVMLVLAAHLHTDMFPSSTLAPLLGVILLIFFIPDVTSFTKYGRTCKDIGCRRDEVCVMAEDPCSIYQRDNCGRYPTCTKVHPGGASCTSTICGENEYCKTENGIPTCVKKSTAIGYESAGVSYVNGHRTSTDENRDKISNSASNSNPYANANAPPAPFEPSEGYHQMNSGINLGYPPYPSHSGSSNGNAPVYPLSNQGSRQQDLGYPPYPTNNRMPMPGLPGQGYPTYPTYLAQPGNPAQPGYAPAPGYQQYPGYQNYPTQNRMNYDNKRPPGPVSGWRYPRDFNRGRNHQRSQQKALTSML